ncbi:hypothetical protein CCHOA_00250 [Corynebacterium choanae]|uniref:Uncharacterized protein n=1 Tax=Corynebacterium choanae TaxID=1862358 RepID=A0A3G6J3H0_9CORY|nr:hypothetical protein CCHOA_00250 [Corynebacterium choanae]
MPTKDAAPIRTANFWVDLAFLSKYHWWEPFSGWAESKLLHQALLPTPVPIAERQQQAHTSYLKRTGYTDCLLRGTDFGDGCIDVGKEFPFHHLWCTLVGLLDATTLLPRLPKTERGRFFQLLDHRR